MIDSYASVMSDRVTLRDILEITQRIEEKIDANTKDITDLKIWRATITAYLGVVVVVFSVAYDYIKSKLFS